MTHVDLGAPAEIWHARGPVPTPLGIAAQLGWITRRFAPHGIRVRSVEDATDPAILASYIDHNLRYSFRQGGSIPAIWARAQGARTRLIGVSWMDESQVVATLPGRGIGRIRDLRGRRVALPRRRHDAVDIFRATAQRALLCALSLDGLGPSDVEWVDIEEPAIAYSGARTHDGRRRPASLYAEQVGALLRGDVDAVHFKGAQGHACIEAIGAQIIVDTGFHPDRWVRINNGTPRPLTVDEATMDDHPWIAQALVAQVVEAGEWAARHPRETFGYLIRETGEAERHVRAAYGPDAPDKLHFGLDTPSIEAITAFAEFLWNQGYLARPLDVREWIDVSPLRQAPDYRNSGVPAA